MCQCWNTAEQVSLHFLWTRFAWSQVIRQDSAANEDAHLHAVWDMETSARPPQSTGLCIRAEMCVCVSQRSEEPSLLLLTLIFRYVANTTGLMDADLLLQFSCELPGWALGPLGLLGQQGELLSFLPPPCFIPLLHLLSQSVQLLLLGLQLLLLLFVALLHPLHHQTEHKGDSVLIPSDGCKSINALHWQNKFRERGQDLLFLLSWKPAKFDFKQEHIWICRAKGIKFVLSLALLRQYSEYCSMNRDEVWSFAEEQKT